VQFGNSGSNALDLGNSTLTIASGITVHGINGGIHSSFGTSAVINQGTIAADDTGGSITIDTDAVTNQGTLQAADGEALTVSNFAPNSGTISVGAGSKVNVSGGFTQSAAGTVSIFVAGTASGQYGELSIAGSATLSGTLNVTLSGGFSPAAGNAFKVLTYGSRSGTFATINTPTLAGGLVLTASYNPGDLTLTTTSGPSPSPGNVARPALVVASPTASSSATNRSLGALSSTAAGNFSAERRDLEVIDLALQGWRALWPRAVRRSSRSARSR
jgi:hypothetical protein